MSTYKDLAARVDSHVRDSEELLTTLDKRQAAREAIHVHSKQLPHVVVEDLSGDGSAYDFTIAAWVQDFSAILGVEYPAGEQVPTMVDPASYGIYDADGSTPKLRFYHTTPSSGTNNIRVKHTALHTLNDLDSATVTTIRSQHYEPFVVLWASRLMRMLATKYLEEESGAAFQADTVERSSKSSDAARISRTLYRQYEDMISGENEGAMVNVDWDVTLAGSPLGQLTHWRR